MLVLAAIVAGLPALAEKQTRSWPQFRGPNGDGVSEETGLLGNWPAGGPAVLWRAELGEGFSGLSVVDGRVFTLAAKGNAEYVVCLRASDGSEQWKRQIDDKYVDRFGNGPRSTPTVDADAVYALGAKGKLVALAASDGSVRWSHDLAAEYGAKAPRWGVATSPLVEGKLLLVNVGGADGAAVVAFQKKNGKEVWRTQDDKAGYSVPVAANIAGRRQVLIFSATKLLSIDPADGALLWDMEWKTAYDINAAAPVFIPPNRVFVSSGYDKGGVVLEIGFSDGKTSVEQVWRNREIKNQFSSSVFRDGHLYGFDDKTLKCIDVETGKTCWRKRGFGHGSLIYADGNLIVLSDHGLLALIEATAEEYRERSSAQLFETKTWTVPTLLNGILFLRDQKEIISVRIGRGPDQGES